MGLFGRLFSGGTPKENSISVQDSLMRSVENVMKINFKGQDVAFGDKILRIWVADNIRYESLQASDFIESLRYHLDSQMGLSFAGVELCAGPLPEGHDYTSLGDSVYMELCAKGTSARVKRAEVFALKNYGSLKKEKYVLDSTRICELPSQRYNIGAGEYPDLNGRFRCNHIAIDDDPESTGYEQNKYVSRTHAFIRFSPKDGFMLQAEPEGTPLAGMRTRILRGGLVIEVDDVVPQPLMNGDCIELSKHVRLMFNTVM